MGTRVAIRVAQVQAQQAHALIDEAFDCIAEIHRLMSFQEAGSDLSRLNREASKVPVQVDQKTWRVLSVAQQFAEASEGCFDVSIAGVLASSGLLSAASEIPIPGACWRDIELLPEHHVRFHRPLWIDLGGIAKGFAVDCAIELLQEKGAMEACVNAGGDLRVFGPQIERVHLLSSATAQEIPVLEIDNAALASSGGDGMHINGKTRRHVARDIRVSVVAPDCMTADALTKIVLADSRRAEALLPQYRAVAYLNDAPNGKGIGWRVIAAAGESSC